MTMNWVDEWLAGLVHPARRSDVAERFRHERFLVARSASALAALVALPPYLLGAGVASPLEGLAVLAMAAPFAALALLSRFGRLDIAQGLVSLALVPLAAGTVSGAGGVGSAAVLALAVILIDALFSGERRAILVSMVATAAGLLLALALPTPPAGAAGPSGALLVVGVGLALGHGTAQLVLGRRLPGLLRSARSAGEAREGATLLSIDDLVTWHDRNGAVLRASPAAARLLGVGASHLAHRGFFERINVADRPTYLKAISDAATSSAPVSVLLRLEAGEAEDGPDGSGDSLRASQRTIWVELRAHRFQGVDDSCAVVAVTREVSHHHERVQDLEARCRRAAQERVDRAELLAAASAELRSLLRGILDHAAMLTGPAATALREHAGMVSDKAERALGVASALADLATVETGYDLVPEPLDVGDLVEEACRAMELAAGRAGITVARDVAEDLPAMHADRTACRTILLHLLTRALRSAHPGALLTVQARRAGDKIALSVAEIRPLAGAASPAALGMALARADASAQAVDLGLTVARSLAALHGGRVDVAGRPGGGFAASAVLPLQAAAGRRDSTARVRLLHPPASERSRADHETCDGPPARLQRTGNLRRA